MGKDGVGTAGGGAGGRADHEPDEVLAASRELIVVIDGHGRVGYASPALRRLTGDGLVGAPLDEVLHPDDVQVVSCLRQPPAEGNPEPAGAVRLAPELDPTCRWYEAHVAAAGAGSMALSLAPHGGDASRVDASRSGQLARLALQLSQAALSSDADRAVDAVPWFARELARVLDLEAVYIDELVGTVATLQGAHVPEGAPEVLGPMESYDIADHPLLQRRLDVREPIYYGTPLHRPEGWVKRPGEPTSAAGALIPLVVEGRLIGVFTVESATPRHWSETERDALRVMGGIIASMFERRRLIAELERRATHDPLTGLANRSVAEDALGMLAEPATLPASVLFIDIDDFKRINDHYGHLVGDAALRLIADRLQHTVRAGDLVARIGGDEFLVVGFRMDEAAAEHLASRVVAAFSDPLDLDGIRVLVRPSIGTATAHDPAQAGELQRTADARMYIAKRDRRG